MKINTQTISKILLVLLLSQFIIGFVNAQDEEPLSATKIHEREGISFETEYQISADFNTWDITDNKAINITLSVLTNPNNATILIEHVHLDIFIESLYSGFDGLTQDTMDDNLHSSLQSGFFVNQSYPYAEVFSVEGSSPTFTENVQNAWLYGDWSSGLLGRELDNFKFSEEALVEDWKVFGQTLYAVYDVLIKYEGEELYHKVIITDNIFIDLEGNFSENEGNILDPDSVDLPRSVFYILVVFAIIGVLIVIFFGARAFMG